MALTERKYRGSGVGGSARINPLFFNLPRFAFFLLHRTRRAKHKTSYRLCCSSELWLPS